MKKILVIDDANSFRFYICLLLKKAGYQTADLENPANVLCYLQKNAIDLLITDMEMPSMTGLELVRQIRSSAKDKYIPIIGMSSGAYEEAFHLGGANSFVSKSNTKNLINEVNRLLSVS